MAATRFRSLFRFCCFVLLVGFLVAGCAGSSPPHATKLFRKSRVHVVSGYVLDAVSRQPLAGVPVYAGRFQSFPHYTDSTGFFRLKSPSYAPFAVDSSVIAQTLYYEGSAAIPAHSKQLVQLLLKRNGYRFRPVGCQRLADSIQVSPYAALPAVDGGRQIAFLIQSLPNQQPVKLRTLTLPMGRTLLPQEQCRLRVYRYNGPNRLPGEDLLEDNAFVCPAGEEASTYDMSSYNIIVPDNGFVLALEFGLGGGGRFYPCLAPLTGYAPNGPTLHPPCAFADTRTWLYEIGKGWHRATPAENCWPLYESALSMEVEPAPTPPKRR